MKGKAGKIVFTLILILWLLLGAVFGVVLLMHTHSPAKRLLGEWETKISLKEEALDHASRYLYEARLGEQVPLEEYLGAPTLSMTLSFYEDGSFSRVIDQASYEKALSAVREGLSFALYQLVILRAAEEGRDNLALEDAKSLTDDALGMSAPAWFEQEEIPLLPSFEELRKRYGQKGTYTVEKELLILDGEEIPFLTGDKLLVLKRSDPADGKTVFENYEKRLPEETKEDGE